MSGVANKCPVFPLIAGTSRAELVETLKGSSLRPIIQTLSAISLDETFALLRSCGVDAMYFSDPDFVRLVEESGRISRLVQHIFEGLTVTYDHSRNAIAKMKAGAYL